MPTVYTAPPPAGSLSAGKRVIANEAEGEGDEPALLIIPCPTVECKQFIYRIIRISPPSRKSRGSSIGRACGSYYKITSRSRVRAPPSASLTKPLLPAERGCRFLLSDLAFSVGERGFGRWGVFLGGSFFPCAFWGLILTALSVVFLYPVVPTNHASPLIIGHGASST